jgi:hypothetical protein
MGYPLEGIAVRVQRTERHHCLEDLVIPGTWVSIDDQNIKTDPTIIGSRKSISDKGAGEIGPNRLDIPIRFI